MKSPLQRDILAATLFIAVALLILFVAIPYGVKEPKKVKFVALSPSYYPRIVSYCLLGFGVLLFGLRLIAKKTDLSSETPLSESSKFNPLNFLLITCTLAFYYFTLPWLGFVVSSAIVLIILFFLAKEKAVWVYLTLPVVLPLGLYFFFTKVANIPIPAGVLEPILVGS